MKRLKYIKLADLTGVGPGGDVDGLYIGDRTGSWTGHKHYLPAPSGGFTGYSIDAEGHTIRCTQSADGALVMRPGSGFTEMHGGRVIMASKKAVSVGSEKTASIPGDICRLIGTNVGGDRGTFGVHGRNFDFDFVDCLFEGTPGQHLLYIGGWAFYGARFRNSLFDGSGTGVECLKAVWRPWESPRWVPMTRFVVEDCGFKNANAGLVLQGVGCDIRTHRLSFKGIPHAYRIDNGLSSRRLLGQGRYWDHNGVAEGPGAANGFLDAADVAIERDGAKLMSTRWQEASNGPGEGYVLLGADVRRCGWYGEGSTVDMRSAMTMGPHDVRDWNSEQTTSHCKTRLGMAAEHEATVYST